MGYGKNESTMKLKCCNTQQVKRVKHKRVCESCGRLIPSPSESGRNKRIMENKLPMICDVCEKANVKYHRKV